jgi:hypothetical protein
VERKASPLIPSLLRSFHPWTTATGGTGEGSTMTSPDAAQVGGQLDEHHSPETNGRMAVCRRCGAKTTGPVGSQHAPDQQRLDRSSEWLANQSQLRRIDRARGLFKA